MADLGDIRVLLSVDKTKFEAGVGAVSKDLARVRSEIAAVSAKAAAGNEQAFLQLVSLVAQEEELGIAAKRAADIELQARQRVMGVRKEELHILAQQEEAERRVAMTASRTAMVRGGGGGGRAGGGMGAAGLAFGLSDAATAYQFGGARGAALAISNNLPQIGQEVASFASRFAKMGGVIGRVATGVSRFAGPLGLLASVALPLAALGMQHLHDKMTETERVTKGLADAMDKAKGSFETRRRLEELQRNPAANLGDQKSRVAGLRDELGVAETARAEMAREFALRDVTDDWASRTQKGDLGLQLVEVEKKISDLHRQVADEERILRNAEAGAALRGRRSPGLTFDEHGINVDLINRHNQNRKLDDLYFRPEREEAAMRQSAVANFEQFAMRRSLLAGLGSRLSGLQQQRQAMAMGGQAFRNPEATTRGNAVDRIIEIAQAKREAKDEVWRKEQLTKLDKQIELAEKLIEEVKNGENGGLKPARVG